MSAAEAIFARELLELRVTGGLMDVFEKWAVTAVNTVMRGQSPATAEALMRGTILRAIPDNLRDTAAQYLTDTAVLDDAAAVLDQVHAYARAQGLSKDATKTLMRSAIRADKGVYVPTPAALQTQVRSRVPQLVPAGPGDHRIPEHPSILSDKVPFAETGMKYGTRLELIGRDLSTTVSAQLARIEAELTGQDLRWVTMGDHRVRDTHRAAQGQTVRYDEWFTVGGIPMEYPGDPAAPFDETVNCRCVLTLVTPAERRYVQSYIPRAYLTAAAPNQARAPKGTPIGGQWIDTPGGLLREVSAAEADPIGDVLGPRGRERTYEELAADHDRAHKSVNPGYEENYTRRYNCSQVSVATELRARGYNAIANDSPTFDGMMQSDVEALFPGARLSLPGGKESAYEEMTREGAGARFIVMGSRRGGVGHAWTAEVYQTEDGFPDIREYDFQSPHPYTGPISGGQGLYMDYRDYRVLRVDNAPLSPEIVTGRKWGDRVDPPAVINFREWEAEAADLAAAADPGPALADLGIDVDQAEFVDDGDRYLVVPADDQIIYDDRATYVDKATGAVTRELPPDSPLANPSLTAAAPNQARAPKGTPIGGQWIDTPGGLLRDVEGRPDARTVVRDQGGASLDPATFQQPTDGYMVAVQGHNLEVPEAEFFGPDGEDRLYDWIEANRGPLSEPGAHIGLWHDTANGEVVFDVSQRVADRDEAIRLGQDRNQQAIWDVAGGEEIGTGGTGDRQETAAIIGVNHGHFTHAHAGQPAGVRGSPRGVLRPARRGEAGSGPRPDGHHQADLLTFVQARAVGSNPNQARAPRGTPIGGQWIDTPSAILHHLGWADESPTAPDVAYTVDETQANAAYGPEVYERGLDKLMPGSEDLSTEQVKSVEGYTGQESYAMNNWLRTGDVGLAYKNTLPGAPQDSVDLLDSVFAPVPGDLVTYRGVGGMLSASDPDALVGTVIRDKGYLSTSLNANTASGPFGGWGPEKGILKITVPKGSPAIWPENMATVSGERELILPHGLDLAITGWYFDDALGTRVYEASYATPTNPGLGAAVTPRSDALPEPLFDIDEGEGSHQVWETYEERGRRLAAESANPSLTAAGPNQARAPKGTPIGGEWIETPGGLAAGIGVRDRLTLGYTTDKELSDARGKALAKWDALPTPTDADRAAAEARHGRSKRQGGDDRPGSQRRKKLRQDLLAEFGDGTTCPCLNCGRRLDITTVSMDRIIPGSDNGRYIGSNLIPMDYDCNRVRSNSDFAEMAESWTITAAAAQSPLSAEPVIPLGTRVRARVSGWGRDASGDLGGADDAPSLDGVSEWVSGPLEGQAVPGYYKYTVDGYDVDADSIEEEA